MRCRACDVALSDYESTRRYEDGTFVDLCNKCFYQSDMEGVVVIDRLDLKAVEPCIRESFEFEGD